MNRHDVGGGCSPKDMSKASTLHLRFLEHGKHPPGHHEPPTMLMVAINTEIDASTQTRPVA